MTTFTSTRCNLPPVPLVSSRCLVSNHKPLPLSLSPPQPLCHAFVPSSRLVVCFLRARPLTVSPLHHPLRPSPASVSPSPLSLARSAPRLAHSEIQKQIIDEQGQSLSFGPIGIGRVAVVTGGASGIGLAAAKIFARQGMKLALADINFDQLEKVGKEIVDELMGGDASGIILQKVDVSKMDEMVAFREKVLDQFGEINVLMLNAAIFNGGGTFANNLPTWHQMIDINLFGVINGTQAFVPFLLHQENPSVVIATGSKQGITGPPGNAAYNVSKAAVKMLTEQLAHELRDSHSNCSAHLFVPGWVHTGAGGPAAAAAEKPPGAWTAKETVAYMLEKLEKGDFYIVCPDNETTEEMDKLRMAWGASDLLLNRPALSRWHPEYKRKFEEYMREGSSPLAGTGRSRSRGRGGDNGLLTPGGDGPLFGGAEIEIKDGGRRTPAE